MDKLDASGVDHETNLWRGFVKSERFKGWVADVPTPELDKRVLKVVQELGISGKPKVLDVGSGPVSILRGALPADKIDIATCDPLSPNYQTMVDFAGLGIAPPEPYPAENLPAEWDNTYDVVHISNALDHVVNPYAAVLRLVTCAKPGGLFIVQSHANEAIHEKWAGFHQFNISVFSGDQTLSIQGKLHGYTIVPEEVGCSLVFADQAVNDMGREWIVWVVRKNASA